MANSGAVAHLAKGRHAGYPNRDARIENRVKPPTALDERPGMMAQRLAVLQFAFTALFCAACLVVAALALGPPPGGLAPGQDKLLHLAAFFILTVLGALAFLRTSVWAPAVGLLAGGIAIELLQGIPAIKRSMSLGDVVADAAGIAAGLVLVAVVRLTWKTLRGRSG